MLHSCSSSTCYFKIFCLFLYPFIYMVQNQTKLFKKSQSNKLRKISHPILFFLLLPININIKTIIDNYKRTTTSLCLTIKMINYTYDEHESTLYYSALDNLSTLSDENTTESSNSSVTMSGASNNSTLDDHYYTRLRVDSIESTPNYTSL